VSGKLKAPILTRVMLTSFRSWVRTGEEGRDGCAVLMCNGDEGSVCDLFE
jgi:hypothetical protein